MIPEPRACTRDLRPPTAPAPVEGHLRLDANTNLYGENPAIARAIQEGAAAGLNHYPSAASDGLREAVARRWDLEPDEVLVGDGSDEVIDVILKAFADPDDIIAVPTPTFPMYAFYARVHGAKVAEVPLRVGWSLNVDALLRADAKITFIASPNNPTGNKFDRDDLERVLERSPGLVVIDEAYADFCGQDFVRRTREFERIIVLRTFSKSHGLAGLRVGYAVAPKPIVARLMAVKAPFTVGLLAERVAIAALADTEYLDQSRHMILAERPALIEELKRLGLRPWASDANFLLVDTGAPAKFLVQRLLERRILVRDMGDVRGLERCIRLTVGRREHNAQLLTALREALVR